MTAAIATTLVPAAIRCVPGLKPVPPRPFTPLHTLWLAAECLGLKALLIEQQTTITLREEQLRAAQAQHSRDAQRIADLIARNQQLTRSLHREATRA